MAVFLDATNLGARPYGGPGVSSHAGSPSAGARSLRFNGTQGGGPSNVAFGIETRPEFSLPGDFHFEGLIQFDAGTTGLPVLVVCHIGGVQFAVYRAAGASGTLVLNVNTASTLRVTGGSVVPEGVLHAWSVTRVSGVWTLRLNGVSQGTYTDAASLGAGSIFFGSGSVVSGVGGLTGYMDEIALYRTAVHAADYTPTFAEVPEGAANPHWESIALLIHGDEALATSAAVIAGPNSLQAFPPTWPAVVRTTPGATRLDPLRNFGTRGLSGVVDYITSPAAGRIVRAYDKASGILLRETTTAGDGTYSFPDLLGGRDYYVVALDSPPNPASAWDTDISPIVQAT